MPQHWEVVGGGDRDGILVRTSKARFFLRGIEALGEHHLRDYFQKFGDVTEVTIVRDKKTKRPRGMGFIAVAARRPGGCGGGGGGEEPTAGALLDDVVQRLVEESHTINSVEVELQEALPKLEDDAAPGTAAAGSEQAVPAAPAAIVAEEEAPPPADPAAEAQAQAQFQMHYLAMAINASVD